MASTNLRTMIDAQQMMAHQVILHVTVKNETWAIRRLRLATWLLRVLAWVGGVKEIRIQAELEQSG